MHNRLGHRLTRRIDVPIWLEPKEIDMPIIVRKSADETVNNSTVLQDDDELVIGIGPNEIWVVEMLVFYQSSTVADLKAAVVIPAGATMRIVALNDAFNSVQTASGVAFVGTISGDGAEESLLIYGIVENGAVPGDIQLQWAQNTLEASDTDVLEHSYLMAWQHSE